VAVAAVVTQEMLEMEAAAVVLVDSALEHLQSLPVIPTQ
jgi:hypothetical protein